MQSALQENNQNKIAADLMVGGRSPVIGNNKAMGLEIKSNAVMNKFLYYPLIQLGLFIHTVTVITSR